MALDYFRCDYCGHLWSYPKENLDPPPIPVTESPEK
jgi:hypothetical protein